MKKIVISLFMIALITGYAYAKGDSFPSGLKDLISAALITDTELVIDQDLVAEVVD